ncbi:MAG: hypothetical protein IT184_03280 [Acidobacteria bacterium]|nr:hypothetical protein [Acidobacteriota bacterium]
MSTLPLGAALKRGAIVTAANWPVVLVDFVLESFYKLTLTVPILGGALMVTAIVGSDLDTVVGEGLRATADLVLGSLSTAPVALITFLVALAIVGVGGEAIMFVVKAGTLNVLVAGERAAADVHVAGSVLVSLSQASAWSLAAVYEGARRFGGRALVLALWLGLVYVAIGGACLVVLGYGLSVASRSAWLPAWPLLVLLATSTSVVAITLVNLVYDLLRVIVVTDDCSVRAAVARLRRFVTEDARHVLGIFSVIGGVVLLATAGSLVAAAGMALTAWIPFLGLVVVPLQAVAWLLRGVSFQFLALAALSAYQTQYRRFSETRGGAVDTGSGGEVLP